MVSWYSFITRVVITECDPRYGLSHSTVAASQKVNDFLNVCIVRSRLNGTVKFGIVIQCPDDIFTAPSYRGYRFPARVISHCVWLYVRFWLSFRDVQAHVRAWHRSLP